MILAALALTLLVAAGCSSGGDAADGAGKADSAVQSAGAASGGDAAPVSEESPARTSAGYTALTVQNLGSPTFPFMGSDGKAHVAYALQLTNAGPASATLQKVDIVDAADTKRALASFSGTALVDPSCGYGDCNRLRLLPSAPAKDAVIPTGESRSLLVDFTADDVADVPKRVLHRITALASANPASAAPAPVSYTVAPKDVSARTARVISPPVRGNDWVAQNGCCGVGFPHVDSLMPFDGGLRGSQRFAIDWMRTDDHGRFYVGDKTRNESYQDYGQEVHAVADGTVTSVLDDVQANAPGILPATVPELAAKLTVENVDGNHVIQDLGGGTWAMYAHLQEGPLTVKPGDKVAKGQVIGLLGNTGNSNAPHLHFQLMDGPNLDGSDGVPYVLDAFDYAGYVEPAAILAADDYLSGAFFAHHLDDPAPRTGELPLNGAIVNFGN
ncbi:M23 family metallopeptidase [Tomitella cavernea]|uniref:M23 family metallopeptidase n=1 Tax=Tomitella cavernea TaxID=1387982 RepID=UPI0027DD8CFA|nr:M23 family metallopeptidase [Tomitella cavernea]